MFFASLVGCMAGSGSNGYRVDNAANRITPGPLISGSNL